jgi:hypothetical protein
VLQQRTTTADDCFYAVWDGFGGLSVPSADIATITITMAGARTMRLLRGPLADAASVSMESPPFEQSPSLWWPADRAWCVATDVDLMSTYIGANGDCTQAILAEPSLETWQVHPADRVDSESDTYNPTPPHPPSIR